ncbi:MAG: hypothetical protein ACLUTU_12335 [Blautia faecis]
MRKKRILAVLLSSAIAFSGMPGNVFAAEDDCLRKMDSLMVKRLQKK